MKSASANMITHLAQSLTTLNACWKYERPTDLQIFGYTDHDATITYDGVDYTPVAAGNLTNFRQSNQANPDGLDVETPFASGAFTLEELRAGIWNSAKWWVFLINPNAVADGIIKLTSGRLGEIEIRDYIAKIEHRSLTQMLSIPILRLITPECNASLGDTRCAVVMAPFTHTGTVGAVTDNRSFAISGAASGKADDYYNYGQISFTSGLNDGLTMDVADYVNSTDLITLIEQMPYTVTAGDTISIRAGCDRRKTTCINRFNNVLNFRGCDLLPGLDKTVVIPNNRRWVTDS